MPNVGACIEVVELKARVYNVAIKVKIMSRIRNDIDSIIEGLKNTNCSQIQDIYDFYRRQYGWPNENFDIEESNKENTHNIKAYESINGLLNTFNANLKKNGRKRVFLSHSHEDFEYTCRVALFLKTKYNVDVYIDELDSLMPLSTNSYTAQVLSEKIRACDRFIFVGTENSFKSKWCNWELGVADFKRIRGHLAFFVMNDQPAKNGNYRKNEYVGLYPFIWDKHILDVHSDEEDLFVGYFKDFKNKETFIPLKEWLYSDKIFFKPNNAPNNSQINQKKTIAVFYFSKYKDKAINAMGYRTLSEAFSDIAFRIGGSDNTYMLWRRHEFNILLENEQNAFNDSRLSRRAINCYNEWNWVPFEDYTQKMLKMIGKL